LVVLALALKALALPFTGLERQGQGQGLQSHHA